MPSTPAAVDRASIARAIAEESLLRGTFTLRSGRTTTYYLDKYLFSTRPDVLRPLAALFAQHVRAMETRAGVKVVRLAGAELGGIPLVTDPAAMEMNLPCLFVRNKKKDYGTTKQLEGVVNKGDAVILLEDVATTGGQALEAVESLKESGARVLGVIATIDRLDGARENVEGAGLLFDAIFNTKDLGVAE